ncbi:MAG: hypothetical protein ACLPQY_21105 [Streptosporangiaceae bacterium]
MNGALIERDARIPDEVVKGLAAMGAFGTRWPSLDPDRRSQPSTPGTVRTRSGSRNLRCVGAATSSISPPESSVGRCSAA